MPIWVNESGDADSSSSAADTPDDDVAPPAFPVGDIPDDNATDTVPDHPQVLDASSGAEIRGRYSSALATHGGMKCSIPKKFRNELSKTDFISSSNDVLNILPPKLD